MRQRQRQRRREGDHLSLVTGLESGSQRSSGVVPRSTGAGTTTMFETSEVSASTTTLFRPWASSPVQPSHPQPQPADTETEMAAVAASLPVTMPLPGGVVAPADAYGCYVAWEELYLAYNHLLSTPATAATPQRKLRPKKHRCPHCQVAFSNNGQLRGHVRIHTGERPYRCHCGKTFTRNEELTRHKRIHSGVRPYACAVCSKRFGRKDHLKKHTRTHAAQYVPVPVPVQPFPFLYAI